MRLSGSVNAYLAYVRRKDSVRCTHVNVGILLTGYAHEL